MYTSVVYVTYCCIRSISSGTRCISSCHSLLLTNLICQHSYHIRQTIHTIHNGGMPCNTTKACFNLRLAVCFVYYRLLQSGEISIWQAETALYLRNITALHNWVSYIQSGIQNISLLTSSPPPYIFCLLMFFIKKVCRTLALTLENQIHSQILSSKVQKNKTRDM